MSRRNKILLIIAIILILAILALLLFLSIIKKPAAVPGGKTPPVTLPKVQNLTPRQAETPKTSPADTTRQTLEALARTFAERFGSFSNQINYQNLADLNPLMTPAVKAWVGTYINKLKAVNPPSGPFYGITTRALNVVVKILDADNADAVVGTQREETKGAASPVILYQDLKLTFKRVNQQWLVDFVKWQ